MNLHGTVRRVTIFVGESDRYHHRPLYAEIVHRAHQAGLAGASVFRGTEGYGASSRIHTSRLLSLSQDLPVAIIVVDTAEATDRFLGAIDDLIADVLVLLDDVQVHRPSVSSPGGTGQGPSVQDSGAPASSSPASSSPASPAQGPAAPDSTGSGQTA
jgi:PII-like signaling protein